MLAGFESGEDEGRLGKDRQRDNHGMDVASLQEGGEVGVGPGLGGVELDLQTGRGGDKLLGRLQTTRVDRFEGQSGGGKDGGLYAV